MGLQPIHMTRGLPPSVSLLSTKLIVKLRLSLELRFKVKYLCICVSLDVALHFWNFIFLLDLSHLMTNRTNKNLSKMERLVDILK